MSHLNEMNKRQFPRGLGEPISRHKVKRVSGEAVGVFEGGPVDLKDPDIIAAEVATQLRVYPYSPATPEEVHMRATNNVRGIIYDGDKTFRYFVWLTCARTYRQNPIKKRFYGEDCDDGKPFDVDMDTDMDMGDVISGASGPHGNKEGKGKKKMEEGEGEEDGEMWTKIVKVPFLVWMGSPCSFLSFDTVDVFFSGPEFEYARYQLSVDGTPFLFHAPDDNSTFNHYNILGRDFMESRFRSFEADYTTLSVLMRRRRFVIFVPGQPISSEEEKSGTSEIEYEDRVENGGGGESEEWIRQRDEELERFLAEEEEENDDVGDEENVEGLRRAEGRVEASIDPRLLEWGTQREQGEQQTEQLPLDDLEKQMKRMQQDHEQIDQQLRDVRQAVQRFERAMALNVPEGDGMKVEEEEKREEGAGSTSSTEVAIGDAAFFGTGPLTNSDEQSEKDGEGNVEMSDSESSREVVDSQIGLQERRGADADGFASPPSTPISRKEGKRSSLVSKENLRVSGGRTGSGMRR
ncbi:hypothetical protein TWF506_002859 [Arthrobotrys conoides]|uniref:Uncharacterized protein n=1 Tax=Arthrobotrys conoides TaxID=74498 RepID=A0AAN8NBW0_9PEZI